jgi:hypothetical protein
LLTLAAAGCHPPERESYAISQQEIVNGVLSGPEDNSVLKVESIDASGVSHNCTATLVAPNLVVTARHCVASLAPLTFTCDSDGNLIAGPGGQTGVLNDPTKISVKSGTIPTSKAVAKGLQIFAAQTTTVCLNDFAMVLLDRALDQAPNSLPISPMRLYAGVGTREQIRMVGYGAVREGVDSGTDTRHTRDGFLISKVGSSVYREVGDKVPPRTFTTDGPGGCYVDSGGPAFSDGDAVVGVFSQFVGDCLSATTVNYFTQVAPFRDVVILPAFKAAGYEPWLEGNSEPGLYGTGGNAGTGGESSTGGVTSLAMGGTGGLSSAIGSGGATFAATNSGGATTTVSASGGAIGGASASTSGGVGTDVGGAPTTGGSTPVGVIYDRGPSKGGSCGCRIGPRRGYGLGVLALAAGILGMRRQRAPATQNRRRRNG